MIEHVAGVSFSEQPDGKGGMIYVPELFLGDVRVQLFPSLLENDTGRTVVQIDGIGELRVNINEGPIWDADTEAHTHNQCPCTTERNNDESDV